MTIKNNVFLNYIGLLKRARQELRIASKDTDRQGDMNIFERNVIQDVSAGFDCLFIDTKQWGHTIYWESFSTAELKILIDFLKKTVLEKGT